MNNLSKTGRAFRLHMTIKKSMLAVVTVGLVGLSGGGRLLHLQLWMGLMVRFQ